MRNRIRSLFRSKALKSRAGSTLLETVISLSLFAVFTAGSSRLIVSQHELSSAADAHYYAANLAKSRLESIRAFQFADATQILDFEENGTNMDDTGQSRTAGPYRRVTTCVMNDDNTVCEVIVDVYIRDRKTLRFGKAKETVKSYFQ